MAHRRAARFLLAVLLAGLLAGPTAASAQTDGAEPPPGPSPDSGPLGPPPSRPGDALDDLIDSEGWTLPTGLSEETLRFMLYEIALIDELDGFTPDHDAQFDRIHAAFGDWPDTDRTQVFEVLKTIDAELSERLPAFNILPVGQNNNLGFAVDRLPVDFTVRLLAGDTSFIVGHEYVGALQQLLTSGAAGDLTSFDPSPLNLQTQLADALERLASAEQLNELLSLETDQLREAVDAMAQRSAAPPGGTNWFIIVVGAVAGGILLGVGAMAIRRRGARTDDPTGTAEVIEAHRRLTGAATEAEIATITSDVAKLLADCSDAVLLRRVPEGLRIAGTTPIITGSALGRIIETGQPLIGELDGDPLWPTGRVAVAGVPAAHKGNIVGAVAVWREASRPFDDDTRAKLELLVPAVGGALARADDLGSMETLAMVDGLTSLGNRRRLDGDLETTLASALAADQPVGFAMIDVDHFKTYNDTHGHTAGDVALQSVAGTIAACVREDDVVYRYGGEEFSILLPGASPEEALAVAERVRSSVEQLEVAGEHLQPGGSLTVSIGIATLETGPASDLKERADAALYRAKSGGRNRIACD